MRLLFMPVTLKPGGTVPEIEYEPAADWAPVTVNPTGAIGVPTVPITLELLTTNFVAPARVCTAPRAAAVATADWRRLTARGGVENSAELKKPEITGVRCNSSTSQAAEQLNQRENFMCVTCDPDWRE